MGGKYFEFYDSIVIGGGLSGLEVYYNLKKGGQKVLLVEIGDIGALDHVNFLNDGKTAFNKWIHGSRDDSNFYRFWKPSKLPHYGTYSGQRQVLGGRSLYWHGVILPIESWALNDPNWPATIANDLNVSWNGDERGLYEGFLADLNSWSFNEINEDKRGLQSLMGFILNLGYSQVNEVPRAVQRFADGRWRAYSPIYKLFEGEKPYFQKSGVLCRSQVTSIKKSFSGGRLKIGINSLGAHMTCVTNNLVLATGAIENARIVSSLIEPILDFNIQDHIIQGFIAILPLEYFSSVPDMLCNAKYMIPGNAIKRSNLFLTFASGMEYVLIDAWEMGEQFPSGVKNLTIRDHEVLIDDGLGQRDFELIRLQKDSLDTFWKSFCDEIGIQRQEAIPFFDFGEAGGTYLDLIESGKLSNTNGMKEALVYPYYCPLGTVDHESGTLPFGELTNSASECCFADNIYVAGPATFPRMGAANPSLTTMCLAKRTAHTILGKC